MTRASIATCMLCLATCTAHQEPPTMTTNHVLEMQLDVQGTGAPLVLVGGGLTGWDSWVPHQQRLASSRTVARAQPLAVQLGLDDAKLPAGYSIRVESAALAAALDAHGLAAPIDVVAWSYGAYISLDFALQHPERIRSLTLIEPPAMWVLGATGRLDADAARESEELQTLYAGMTGDVSEAQLAAFCRQAGLVPEGMQPEQLPPWPSWVKHRRSLRTGNAIWDHRDTADRLRAFDRPVLLVKGTGSSHFLHQIIDGLAASLPHAQVIELPGGHAPQLVAIDAFLDALAEFQRGVR
ncbi:MAG TPA: alpha/beta hydrolase [Kofleriaceae bacterium]|nr:alpha/beta hydrolase [Kofleriaceae bacterium]